MKVIGWCLFALFMLLLVGGGVWKVNKAMCPVIEPCADCRVFD